MQLGSPAPLNAAHLWAFATLLFFEAGLAVTMRGHLTI
jgi:hypothetical protein